MYIIVGINEHVLIVEATPYDNTMFGGRVVATTQQNGQLALVAGGVDNVDGFFNAWRALTDAAQNDPEVTPTLASLLQEHDVTYLQPGETPDTVAAYFRDHRQPNGISGVASTAGEPFTFCHSEDQSTHLVKELQLAVKDFLSTAHPAEETLYSITRFVRAVYPKLDENSSIRYVNLRTGEHAAVLDSEQPE